MAGAKESVVLKECLIVLDMLNIYHWRNNTGAVRCGKRFIRFGYKGSADILGILPDGRFLAVECKREKGGKLSDAQREFLNNISLNGGVALVINDSAELFNTLHLTLENSTTILSKETNDVRKCEQEE